MLLALLVFAALLVCAGESRLLAAGVTAAASRAVHTSEPALMLLSGAALLAVASALRRLVP